MLANKIFLAINFKVFALKIIFYCIPALPSQVENLQNVGERYFLICIPAIMLFIQIFLL